MEFLGTDYRYFPKENTYREVKIRKKGIKVNFKIDGKNAGPLQYFKFVRESLEVAEFIPATASAENVLSFASNISIPLSLLEYAKPVIVYRENGVGKCLPIKLIYSEESKEVKVRFNNGKLFEEFIKYLKKNKNVEVVGIALHKTKKIKNIFNKIKKGRKI